MTDPKVSSPIPGDPPAASLPLGPSGGEPAVFTLDPEGNLAGWSPGAERLTGYPAGEVLGRGFTLFHPSETRESPPLASSLAVASSRGAAAEQGWVTRRDGSRVAVTLTLCAMTDAADQVSAFAGILRAGMTTPDRRLEPFVQERTVELLAELAGTHLEMEQLEAVQEALHARVWELADFVEKGTLDLHRKEAELLRIIDAVPALVAYVDAECRYRLNNLAYEKWFGLSRDQIYGRRLWEVLGEATWNTIRPYVGQALAGESVTYDTEAAYEVGGTRWINASYIPHRGEDGTVLGFVVLVHDITDRKRAEEGVRLLMQHARCLLWHATVLAPEPPSTAYRWHLQFFDDNAAQSFLPLDLLPGETYDQAFYRNKPEEDRKYVDRNAREAFENGRSHYSQEYRCLRRDGEMRWLSEQTHLESVGPGLWRAVGVCTDITEHKRLEEVLRQRAAELTAADRYKDEFLAMLAHELRNPLGAISNGLHVMSLSPPGSPAYERARQVAVRQITHQTRLVEDLLDLSRITQGKVALRQERVDLVRLARQSAEDHRSPLEAVGLLLSLELPEQAVWITGDPIRLTQVAGNLLDNARKFTPRGGQVTLRVESPDSSGQAGLTVRDTGAGIEAELLDRLFEPFTQADRSLDRSAGGLGLGLALVRGLVELHGGKVEARSQGPGRGSEFVVRLPVAKAEGRRRKGEGIAPEAERRTPNAERRPPKRILVIEDIPDAAETLRDLLELFGHEVAVAHSGAEGLRRAAEFGPEVVLCDIGLPGMDGYQVAAALRQQPSTAGSRLVAITGYGADEDRQRSREAGFDLHLTKPVDPERLRQALVAQEAR